MRVLIVSHNVFSATESMGKTLMAYFSAFKPEELAQFYIHSQVPTQDNCSRYYRMTDKETGELRTIAASEHCFLNRSGKPISLKRSYPEIDTKFFQMMDEES